MSINSPQLIGNPTVFQQRVYANIKETWNPTSLRICMGSPYVNGGIPLQRTSNVDSVSMSWYRYILEHWIWCHIYITHNIITSTSACSIELIVHKWYQLSYNQLSRKAIIHSIRKNIHHMKNDITLVLYGDLSYETIHFLLVKPVKYGRRLHVGSQIMALMYINWETRLLVYSYLIVVCCQSERFIMIWHATYMTNIRMNVNMISSPAMTVSSQK